MDRDTGIVSVRQRFLNARASIEPSQKSENQSWPALWLHAKLYRCARFPGAFTVTR